MKKFNKSNILTIFLLFGIGLILMFPLFRSGFFVTDDGEWMIIRLSAFYQALADGQFPTRFLGRLNYEYGYPASNFLYPGFLYIGSLIHLLKIGFVVTIKIILGASIISSAVFTFFWLKNYFSEKAGLVGSIVFIYSPYFLFDIYKRGSVGEALAIAIVPFILWQLERGSHLLPSLGIGFLILSHNILALLFVSFIGFFMLLNTIFIKKEIKLTRYYLTVLFFGFGISTFFWLPIFFELGLTKFSQTNISDWRMYFSSYSLVGYSTIFIGLISLGLLLIRKANLKNLKLTVFLFLVFSFSIFMATNPSSFLWQILPANFIQFPFRFLSLSIISGSFLSAFVYENLEARLRVIYVFIIALMLLTSASQQLNQIEYNDKAEGFYLTNNATTTIHDEYMPIWVEEEPIERPEKKVEIISGRGEISNLIFNNKKLNFSLVSRGESVVQINTIYWPGWIASIDSQKTEITYNNPEGVMRILVPKGIHEVEIKFVETDYRLLADFISLASLLLLMIFSSNIKLWKK